MNSLQKQFLHTVKIVVLALIVGLGINYAFAISWTPPSGAPPTNNTAAPLNVSGTVQTKTGGLVVGSGLSQSQVGFVVNNGKMGVGTLNPAQKLEVVNGNVGASGFCLPGSLPTGGCITTWPVGGGGGGGTVISGTSGKVAKFNNGGNNVIDSKIYDNGTNVGIGTTNPTKTLDVAGSVRIQGGSPQAGDVLYSTDNQGNATWKPATITVDGGTCEWQAVSGGAGSPQMLTCSNGKFVNKMETEDFNSGTPTSMRVKRIQCCSLKIQ